MKTIVTYVLTALLLGAFAGLVLAGGLMQRRLGSAQQALSTGNLATSAGAYADVERSLAFTEMVPGLLRGTRDEVLGRQTAIRYWRGDFAGLVADYVDVSRPDVRDIRDLQLVVANAAYRAAQEITDDRAAALSGLDRAIVVYQQVVQNTNGDADAAFNYEYLVRLRKAILVGAEIPARPPLNSLGMEGEQPEEMEWDDYKIYVPYELEEEGVETEDPTMGGDPPIRRRG